MTKIKINKIALIEESKKFENIPCPNKDAGYSCGQAKKYGKLIPGKMFVYTHRARSKFYDSIEEIPQKTKKFIASTG